MPNHFDALTHTHVLTQNVAVFLHDDSTCASTSSSFRSSLVGADRTNGSVSSVRDDSLLQRPPCIRGTPRPTHGNRRSTPSLCNLSERCAWMSGSLWIHVTLVPHVPYWLRRYCVEDPPRHVLLLLAHLHDGRRNRVSGRDKRTLASYVDSQCVSYAEDVSALRHDAPRDDTGSTRNQGHMARGDAMGKRRGAGVLHVPLHGT